MIFEVMGVCLAFLAVFGVGVTFGFMLAHKEKEVNSWK